jgi:O-antigen ligase
MTGVLPWLQRNEIAIAVLALVVGSDYKFRTRDEALAVSGDVDAQIVVEVGLYALVGVWVLWWMTRGLARVRRTSPVLLSLLACYLTLILTSVPHSPYPTYAAVRAAEALVAGGVAVVIGMRAEAADLHRVAHGFLLLIAGSVVFGAAVPAEPVNSTQAGRFTWLAVHPTVAGAMLCIAAAIAAVYVGGRRARSERLWSPWVYVAALAVVCTGLVATQTRAAVAAAIVAILLVVWLRLRRHLADLVAALVALVALIGSMFWTALAGYVTRGESTAQLLTLNSRTELWSIAWRSVQRQPVFGHGVGAVQGVFRDESTLGGGHNAAINVAVDLGIVGVVVWSLLMIVIAVELWTWRNAGAPDRLILLAVFTAVQLDGLFYSGPGGIANVSATWTFVVLGGILANRRVVPESAPTPVPRRWHVPVGRSTERPAHP